MLPNCRRILHRVNLRNISKLYSTKCYNYLDIEHTNDDYSLIYMKKAPVNSLCLDFNNEIIHALESLEENKNIRGVILTSKISVFSAGLDFKEIYQPQPERLHSFWQSFQNLHIRLFSTPLITISAINGACLAGGCAISFSCDYRIAAQGNYRIGLIPTKIGLYPPFWLYRSLESLVGHREADRMLALGETYLPENALCKGIVDEVVSNENLLSKSVTTMNEWLKTLDVGRIQTKQIVRKKLIDEFKHDREDEAISFVQNVMLPETQELLRKHLQNLGGQ